MFKDIKGILSEELKKSMRIMAHQVQNIHEELRII